LPKPELVIYFDVPIYLSRELISKRYEGDLSKKDIHERDIAYLEDCYRAAMYAINRLGWQRIGCTESDRLKTIDQIAGEIQKIVGRYL
jgi:dTMP kinase